VDDGITLIMALKQQIEIVGLAQLPMDYSYDVINKILKWHHKGGNSCLWSSQRQMT
jgi:pyrimidine-specific ribonucleoside hydrolase